MRALTPFFIICALAPHAAPAQVTLVDEGTFMVTREGRAVGREDFSIRSTAGVMLVAQANASYGERRLTSALTTEPGGRPLRYSVDVRAGSASESISAQATRGRMVTRVKSGTGEAEREYAIGDSAVIVDDDLWHQHYFLARAVRNGSIAVVVPRRGVQQLWRVSTAGLDTLRIGSRSVPALRIAVRPEGAPVRQIWIDSGTSRVLRIAIPADGIVATRSELPE